MNRGYLHLIAASATTGLLVGWLLALTTTTRSAAENAYIRHGFYRTIVYTLSSDLGRFILPTLVVALAMAFIVAVWTRFRGDGDRLLAVLLGLVPAGALFLKLGYGQNRLRFATYWGRRREFLGIDVPEALFRLDVWKVNALIFFGAIAIGLIIWWISRRGLRGDDGPLRSFWHAAGHPISLVLMLVLGVGPAIASGAMRRSAQGRPNFILISLDALRVDHLGCYGYSRDTSPVMDQLAAQGIRFDWAICQAPTTLPSHLSTLTSLYPTVHGVRMGRRLAGKHLTLAEYLREHGYRTAGCTDGGYMRSSYGFGQGFELYNDRYKGSTRAVRRILRWLDDGLSNGPFFVLMHTYDIHSPYNPPKPWRDMFTDPGYDGGFNPTSQELRRIRKRTDAQPERGHGLSNEDVEFVVGRYDGGIRWVDHWIGKLVKGLEERGLLESTWIVIAADHGEEFTEHGSFLHGKLYLTVAHVPLIIRPPGPAGDGCVIPEIVELIDLMPTFLELAGIAAADTLQGQSLIPLIEGNASGWKNIAFSEHHSSGGRRAVTSPALHIITSLEHGELEVYDYHADPLEQSPLDDPLRVEGVQDLLRKLQEWSRAQILLAADQEGIEPAEIDLETIEELRSLGYIE